MRFNGGGSRETSPDDRVSKERLRSKPDPLSIVQARDKFARFVMNGMRLISAFGSLFRLI